MQHSHAVAAPAVTSEDPAVTSEERANRVFSTSILLSGIRCLVAYIVFPWLLPALGVARGIGPGIGVVISVVAIAFNVASIRRFHASDHHWKWPITVLNTTVIAMLGVLLVMDITDLVG